MEGATVEITIGDADMRNIAIDEIIEVAGATITIAKLKITATETDIGIGI